VRHHRSVAYSVELVLLNKHQIYGGTPKVNCYRLLYLNIKSKPRPNFNPNRLTLTQYFYITSTCTSLQFSFSDVWLTNYYQSIKTTAIQHGSECGSGSLPGYMRVPMIQVCMEIDRKHLSNQVDKHMLQSRGHIEPRSHTDTAGDTLGHRSRHYTADHTAHLGIRACKCTCPSRDHRQPMSGQNTDMPFDSQVRMCYWDTLYTKPTHTVSFQFQFQFLFLPTSSDWLKLCCNIRMETNTKFFNNFFKLPLKSLSALAMHNAKRTKQPIRTRHQRSVETRVLNVCRYRTVRERWAFLTLLAAESCPSSCADALSCHWMTIGTVSTLT